MNKQPIVDAARLKVRANERQARDLAEQFKAEGNENLAQQQRLVADGWKAMLAVLNQSAGEAVQIWPDPSKPYYVCAQRDGGGYDLRQTRYRAQFLNGSEHPHDVCASGFTKAAMAELLERHGWDVDTSYLNSDKGLAS